MRLNVGLGGLAVAFANPNFRLYTLAAIPSLLGTWVQRVAVGWLAWELTSSSAWVGAVAFADMFPVIIVTPVAGAFADRLDRLAVARLVQYGAAAQSIALAALTMTGAITIELLFTLALLYGLLQAFFHPFRQALIANMVGPDELPPAIAVNSMTWHGARFVGPALAGVIIASLGTGAAIAINATTYAPYLIALYRLRVPSQPEAVHGRSLRDIPREIAEGIRFAVGHPAIGPMFVILFAISVAGRATTELMPGFVGDVFGRGAVALAWLTSSAGLGALIGATWFAGRSELQRLPALVVAMTAVLAVSLYAFVATASFWMALPAIAVSAFALTIGGISTQTIVQSCVPEQIRGRMLGLYGLLWLGCPAIGALAVGVVSDVAGLRTAVALVTLLPAVAWLWSIGRRRAIGRAVAEHRLR